MPEYYTGCCIIYSKFGFAKSSAPNNFSKVLQETIANKQENTIEGKKLKINIQVATPPNPSEKNKKHE